MGRNMSAAGLTENSTARGSLRHQQGHRRKANGLMAEG
jgi:hypothetical protein